jgi:hypothetical protein
VISFWVNDEGSFGIRDYLASPGSALANQIELSPYENLGALPSFRSRAHIFAGLDQLTDAQRKAVAQVHGQLSRQPGIRLLNNPNRTLRRYELLHKLNEVGINQFRAYRVDESRQIRKFPVFIREEAQHTGAITDLLHSRSDVSAALMSLRVRGFRSRDLLIVEFCNTAATDGTFRKYAAMKVGDSIIPRHAFTGTRWMLKGESNDLSESQARDALAYVRDNPHGSVLSEIFDLAGVDYGRVDYSMRGSAIQVWEINLNPTLARGRQVRRQGASAFEAVMNMRRAIAAERLAAAFARLDEGPEPAEVRIAVSSGILEAIERDLARVRRHQRWLATLQRIYDDPVRGGSLRWLFRRLFPRP